MTPFCRAFTVGAVAALLVGALLKLTPLLGVIVAVTEGGW